MRRAEVDVNPSDFLTVGEAAHVLGVSPSTLRNWDRAGKLRPLRHPYSGYRIYRRSELESILPNSARDLPELDWSNPGQTGHLVQFYESDEFLAESVAEFVAPALAGDEGAIVIATASHRETIERGLAARCIDVESARMRGQYIALDAADTLAHLMENGSPDPRRFIELSKQVIATASSGRKGLRVFGEMVALLWDQGNKSAAVRLEELWNELATSQKFVLLCAYPMSAFAAEEDADPFHDICTSHSRVRPAESYASLSTSQEQLLEITLLQQKAQALAAEVAQRQRVEHALEQSEHHLRALVELVHAGVCVCEAPSGRIRYFNRRAVELWGRAPSPQGDEQFCGSHRMHHLDGRPLPHAKCPMAEVLAGAPPVRNQELEIERPDGTRIRIVMNIDRILDSSGKTIGAVNVIQDVSEFTPASRPRSIQ